MIIRPQNLLFLIGIAASASADGLSNTDTNTDTHTSLSSTTNTNDTKPPKAHQLTPHYTFSQYLTHFSKSYPNPKEYSRRESIFASNLAKILSHNEGRMDEDGKIKLGLGGYVKGVNQFTDMEEDELPFGYDKLWSRAWRGQFVGRLESVSQTARKLDGGEGEGASEGEGGGGTGTKSYMVPPDFHLDEVSDLPPIKDWNAEGVMNPTVPQQGGCGSCWTFAATAVIESHLSISTGEPPVSLSEQNLLSCSPDPEHCGGEGGCTGSTVELAYNYVAEMTANNTGGMYSIEDMPYHASGSSCDSLTEGQTPIVGITGWSVIPSNDYKYTMNALAKVGPLAIAVAASEWALYESGVFDTTATTINHAVVLAGYGVDETSGEKYYLVRNSWGPSFGEEGYIRIKRTDEDSNNCGMDNDPLVGIACALDENGNEMDVQPVKVCASSGVLFDSVYPVGAHQIV